MQDLLFLAHGGEGATWQALVTMLCLGILVVFVLVVTGHVTIAQPDDALLPIAGVAVLAALAPSFSDSLSDWIGWALPAGAVALIALGLHTGGVMKLHPPGPILGAPIAVAVVAVLIFQQPLKDAWHPPLIFTAQRDDAVIEIESPSEGDTLDGGSVVVEIAATGATLLPGESPVVAPTDPEELARLKVLVDGLPYVAEVRETCTETAPCTDVSFVVDLSPGAHNISVELLTALGITFEQVIFDVVNFEVAEG